MKNNIQKEKEVKLTKQPKNKKRGRVHSANKRGI